MARKLFPDLPQVMVFDTAFHHTIPEVAHTYAVPRAWREEHHIRRYGFHGTSHAFVSRAAAAALGREVSETNVIVLHLGNGASATAVRGGESVDTSMGLTPLEGLVMGTRSGDLDPAVHMHLHRSLGWSLEDIDRALNRESGLKGLAGENDFREVMRLRASGDAGAALAFDVYCYRIRKYVGAYYAVLGTVHAVVFTAGVGQHSAELRAAALSGLDRLGIVVDDVRNEGPISGATFVSPDGADVAVLVIPTNEEYEIARQALEVVRDRELVVSGPPGAGRILAVSAAPLPRDSETGRARALLIFRDATVEHARRVDLTAFAEVVAHDLRNPLAAVESWTEMMAAELEDGAVETGLLEEYIDRVGSGTRRMTALIEDLLGRATQDAALQLRRVDVATLAEEVAADHGATDQVKVGDIPEVRADAALVRQVLDNLLGNALKFVAPGDEPRITVTGRRTDSGTVAIAVADQGVGLPPGADERVFEEHHRAHPSYDGRGLGLAICRRVVERHGGSITARNNPAGRGAVFELTLPSAD